MFVVQTAEARPMRKPSTKCCHLPAPPQTSTGTVTAADTSAVQLVVVSLERSVPLDRGDQDLPGAQRPVRAVAHAAGSSPVGRAAERPHTPRSVRRHARRVDRHHHALRAVSAARLGDQRRPFERTGIEHDLVGADARAASARPQPMRTPPPAASGTKQFVRQLR